MEYINDLRCNQRMSELAGAQLHDVDIVTCWPFTHMLAAPEFGYVEKPLSLVCVNMGAEFGASGAERSSCEKIGWDRELALGRWYLFRQIAIFFHAITV